MLSLAPNVCVIVVVAGVIIIAESTSYYYCYDFVHNTYIEFGHMPDEKERVRERYNLFPGMKIT